MIEKYLIIIYLDIGNLLVETCVYYFQLFPVRYCDTMVSDPGNLGRLKSHGLNNYRDEWKDSKVCTGMHVDKKLLLHIINSNNSHGI